MEVDETDPIQFIETEKYSFKSRTKFEVVIKCLEEQVHGNSDGSFGLSAAQTERLLITMVNMPTSSGRKISNIMNLPCSFSSRVLQCLVPNVRMKSNRVIAFASKILTSFRVLDVKNTLEPFLRWLNCMLQYAICPPDELEPIFELLLPLLQKQTLINLVSDILFKLTSHKRHMVTRRRLNILQTIRRDRGPSSQLDILIKRYHNLRPDLSVGQTTSYSSSTTKIFNGAMEKTFAEIWSNETLENGLDISLHLVKADSLALSRRPKPLIPHLSSEAFDQAQQNRKPDVLIHELKTLRELVKNIHRLKMPSQALSLLRSPHLCYLVLLNPTPTEIQERLSMTLYFTLHNEFLSLSRSKRASPQKTDLLCRINMLQEWLQRGLPVVGRFLAVYLSTWDGCEYFLEICKMLSFLPIVDLIELEECILAPLRSLCNDGKLSCVHQLILLSYLSKLIQHWASFQGKAHKRKDPFLWANNSCDDPLATMNGLCDFISQQAEGGLCQLLCDQQEAIHLDVYQHEIMSIFSSLSRCFVRTGIPIRPELPSAFIYISVFGRNLVFFSKALEYLTSTKLHVLPMCKNILREESHRDKIHQSRRKMAKITEDRMAKMDHLAKDIVATIELGISSQCLTRGESIFRKDWIIEDDYIRDMLSLKDHLVLFPYLLQLFQHRNTKTTLMDLADETSPAFEKYWQNLSERVPAVTEFLTAFRTKIDIVRKSTSQPSIISTATSGLGSMDSS